jgi:hypothetical protein
VEETPSYAVEIGTLVQQPSMPDMTEEREQLLRNIPMYSTGLFASSVTSIRTVRANAQAQLDQLNGLDVGFGIVVASEFLSPANAGTVDWAVIKLGQRQGVNMIPSNDIGPRDIEFVPRDDSHNYYVTGERALKVGDRVMKVGRSTKLNHARDGPVPQI